MLMTAKSTPVRALAKKVPVVMQMEATECGAACFCMILAYYGRWEPLEKVRTECGVSRDGSKASNILKAARAYGMDAHGYTFSLEGIREKVAFPCILFWNFNHFVVLDGFRGKWAYLNDPTRGQVRVSMEEFDRSFTGVALTIQPTEAFETGGAPKSTIAFVHSRLAGLYAPIAFVALASSLIEGLAPSLLNAVLLFLYLGVMLSYSWKLTLIVIIAILINTFLANYLSQKRVNVTRQQMRDSGMFYAATIAGIESIETLKASGAEDGYFERWSGLQALTNDVSVRFAKTNLYLGALPAILTQLANIMVLLLGTYLIMQDEFTAGSLLAFQGFLSSFMGPVQSLIGLGQQVQEMRTSMERVQDVLEYPADVPEEDEKYDPEADHSKLSGAVELQHLSFGYSPLEPPLIDDFSLSLQPGQWVALVGASGSGKSTIAKLVSGLYEPWGGNVYFDGMPISEIARDRLRGSLAVVDQEIVTFEDSIGANIRLWDRSIEDFEVIMAARDAEIHSDIMARDEGYREKLISGGRNFSGGQLQRLEIARVLAQDPTVIILDEATSALDNVTQRHVSDALDGLACTRVVIAHRLSTIRHVDRIIMLDGGKVVEDGTYDELVARQGAFADLVARQRLEGE